jgi:phasin family protein
MMAKKPTAKAAKPATKSAKPKKEKSTAERIAEPLKKAGETMRKSAGKAVENTVAINTKVIGHAETNAREAFSAMRKVATAKSVQDVMKIQSAFVKEQSARSTAQVREVGELIASFGRDALAMMRGK